MSNYWMVTGVVKTATGSFDTFFDTTIGGQGYTKGTDHAYIGIAASGFPPDRDWETI